MITRDSFQSSIATELVKYITLKQALGRSFESASITLLNLDRFLCKLGKPSPDLTAETFRQWRQTMESICSNGKLARMRAVRNFCLYRRRTAPTCFVPDPTQFPPICPTVQPYIFSDMEVATLLSHCDSLPVSPKSPLRAVATRLAIVLLYTTGLRRGELLRLTTADYDHGERTLLIRESKFHKTRILPLPNDVAMEVVKFLQTYKAVGPRLQANSFLLWHPACGGRAYTGSQLGKNMRILLKHAGIRKPGGGLPRIHDFHFSFAVNALIRWYRNGADVQAKLPYLAAYMGHVSILSTHYYLRFIAPLAALASSAFAARYGALIQEDGEVCHET